MSVAILGEIEETKEEEQMENTLVGQWLKKVKDAYFCLSKRLDEEVWQELLQDEVCIDLAYAEEAKWKFFQFFTNHYWLSSQIYQMFNECFAVWEREAEFREHLPAVFVEYMIRKIQDIKGEEDFPFQWLEGADTANYDEFLERLLELEELLNEEKAKEIKEKEVKEAEQIVIIMEQLGITHPYYQLAKLRLTVLKGGLKEVDWNVVWTAKRLIEDYPEDMKIQILSAEVLWNYGEKEAAVAVFQKVHEAYGIFFLVEKYLAFYQKEQGNLAKAIEHCLEALQKAGDEKLEELQKELDAAYIEKCREIVLEESLTKEDAEQLCRAYLRSGRLEEGIAFLLEHPEYKEEIESICSSLVLFYIRSERYEESVKEVYVWRKMIQDRIEERKGETIAEEEAEDRWNLAVSYSYEGLALRMLAKNAAEEGKRDGSMLQKAEKALEKALEYAPENVNMKQDLLDILVEEGLYQKAVELADELLSCNREWFPAFVQKQKACYELGQAQEVVDLFYQAKEIYSKDAQIYELAIRIFCDYKQFQDAEGIWKQAQEAGAESFGLSLAYLHCERMQCKSDISYFETWKKAEALLKKWKEKDVKKKELSALYLEMSILENCQHYQGFMHPGRAEEDIKRAIALQGEAPITELAPYYYTYGQILQNAKRYEEALKAYQIYEKNCEMTEPAAMNLAQCYEQIGEWENAIHFYQQALLICPDQKEANGKIAAIYKKEGEQRGSIPLIQKALTYEEKQLALLPESAYHYRMRGILYKMLGHLEKALEDTEEAIRLEKENPYGFNLKGRILYYMGEYQQALFFYKKSAANLEDPKTDGWAIYTNAAECCQKMGDYEQAEKWYRKGIELLEGSNQAWCYLELVKLYKGQRRYQEAFQLLKESFEKGSISEEQYLLRSFAIKRILCQDSGQARQLEQEAWEAAEKFDSIAMWEELSNIQYYYLFDEKSGIETKEMVMERLEEKGDWWNHKEKLIERMQIYWELGKKQEVEKWGEIYIQAVERYYCFDTEAHPAMEQYLNDPNDAYKNLCNLIRYWMFTDQIELAKEGIGQARLMKKCRNCRQCDCILLDEVEAIYLEAIGEDLQAYRCYCEMNKRWPASSLSYYKRNTFRNG